VEAALTYLRQQKQAQGEQEAEDEEL
jgi:hypothetical protein